MAIPSVTLAQSIPVRRLQISIIVFSAFSMVVGVAMFILRILAASSEYDVEESRRKSSRRKKKGEANDGYAASEDRKKHSSSPTTDPRWVQNYVPFGKLPSGKEAQDVSTTSD